jgi:hypothetical protein
MNKQIEVLKLALEVLDLSQALLEKSSHHNKILAAYIALREALAEQPQQEPVAQNICIGCANSDSWGLPDKPACRSCVSNSEWSPLNRSSVNPITPPAAQPEQEQRKSIPISSYASAACPESCDACEYLGSCTDADDTLLEEPEQEPTTGNILMDSYKAMQSMKTIAQPQRTWVEVEQVKWESNKLIAKLKEKNGGN